MGVNPLCKTRSLVPKFCRVSKGRSRHFIKIKKSLTWSMRFMSIIIFPTPGNWINLNFLFPFSQVVSCTGARLLIKWLKTLYWRSTRSTFTSHQLYVCTCNTHGTQDRSSLLTGNGYRHTRIETPWCSKKQDFIVRGRWPGPVQKQ